MRNHITAGLLAAACALAVAGCSIFGGTKRPPLEQPPASSFKAGTCTTIAEPVLALGRFTYDKAEAKKLSIEDRAKLVEEGEKLVTARESAEPALAERMTKLLVSIGFVRIRVGNTYDPKLLADVESARMELQTACIV